VVGLELEMLLVLCSSKQEVDQVVGLELWKWLVLMLQ